MKKSTKNNNNVKHQYKKRSGQIPDPVKNSKTKRYDLRVDKYKSKSKKFQQRQEIYEHFGDGTEWTYDGEKEGGGRDSGELGGIYADSSGKKALIKKDEKSPNFDIAEYISSKIFAAVAPGYGAEVDFVIHKDHTAGIPGDGKNVYIRSKFFDNYTDMFKDMNKALAGKKNAGIKYIKKDGRPLFMGTREKLYSTVTKAFKKRKYQGFSNVAPGSLLIGDLDFHTGNIGVVTDDDGKNPSLRRIDFGWGIAKLSRDIHPHKKSPYLPGKGPTNHFNEFPKHLKLNKEFVAGLKKAANADIKNVLEKSFDELQKYYDESTLKNWARHAMPNEFPKKRADKDIQINEIKDTFVDIMQSRQKSLKEFALQIEVGLMYKVEKNVGDKGDINPGINSEEFKNLVAENLDYFKKVANGEIDFKFRDSELRDNLITKKYKILKGNIFSKKHRDPKKEVIEAIKTSVDLIEQSKKVWTNRVSSQSNANSAPNFVSKVSKSQNQQTPGDKGQGSGRRM